MVARARAVTFGFLIWLVAFVAALLISPLRESARPLFESIMPVVVTVATVVCGVLYLRKVRSDYLREGILLGALWFAISVIIDLPLMLSGPIEMSLAEYAADIGLTYLIIPTVTVGIACACAEAAGGRREAATAD